MFGIVCSTFIINKSSFLFIHNFFFFFENEINFSWTCMRYQYKYYYESYLDRLISFNNNEKNVFITLKFSHLFSARNNFTNGKDINVKSDWERNIWT